LGCPVLPEVYVTLECPQAALREARFRSCSNK